MADIFGTESADLLTGTTGDDTINALGGNDTIFATKGRDTVNGGNGTDTLVVNFGDTTRFAAETGPLNYFVTANRAYTGTPAAVGQLDTTFSLVERVRIIDQRGPAANVNATGFAGQLTVITGNGNDVITGGSGGDTLRGDLGANTVDGGAGTDAVYFSLDTSLAFAVLSDTQTTYSVSYTTSAGTFTSTAVNVEAYFLETGILNQGLRIDGSGLLYHGSFFTDYEGDDVLIGSRFTDTMVSYIETVNNVVTQRSGGLDYKVGNGGADDFDYSVAIPRNDTGDHILDFDSDDYLDFGYYDATVNGPDPTFLGTGAFTGVANQYRYEARDGKTFIYTDYDGDGVGDGLITIENGEFQLVETRNADVRNQLRSAVGQIFQSGGEGAETFSGNGPGVAGDVIRTYGGNDLINLSGGVDFIDGGAGFDMLSAAMSGTQFAAAAASRNYTLTSSRFFEAGGALNTSFLNIERVTLNTVNAGNYGDLINASGFTGSVSLQLGGGNDTAVGTALGDIISGGAGADVLTGGAGVDTLTGGADADIFRDTAAGLNGDTITDFSAIDRIALTDAALAGFQFAVSGTTLSYTGGSVTLTGGAPAGYRFSATAGALGGVELKLVVARIVQDDFNGDGRSDVLWRNDNGALTDWLGQGNGGFAINDPAAYTTVPLAWKVAGVGDFNGDGRSDVLWRNDNGALTDWLGQANGGFALNDANAYAQVSLDWKIAGVGDFNGDGRSDVLWRNDNGALTDWLGQANGGFALNDAAAYTTVPTSWRVAGVGDFNGDGRDDILWRNDNGALTDWLGQANGSFALNDAAAYTTVPTSWRVAGVGDFNGDGRDDILWRNDNGALTDWLGQANGGFALNDPAAFTTVPTSWKVANVGDYNGDGRDDILWRNDNGALTDWLGQANGGFTLNDPAAFTTVPTAWKVADTRPLLGAATSASADSSSIGHAFVQDDDASAGGAMLAEHVAPALGYAAPEAGIFW